MGIKSKNQIEKEQAKQRKRRFEEKILAKRELDNLSVLDKLQLQISELKSRIKNCEYDCRNSSLVGSVPIKNKINIMKQQLNVWEDELKCLQNAQAAENN